jgi:hypothetical protein
MDPIALRALADHTIWMLHDGGHAVVVDPDEAAPVERTLERHERELAAILVTHPRHGHPGRVEALQPHRAPSADHIASCERLRAGCEPTLPSRSATQRRFEPSPRRAQAAVVDRACTRSVIDVIAASRRWKNEYR